MKRFTLLFGLILALFTTLATATPVELLKASSRLGSKYGYSWQDFSFNIRVDNLAFSKKVSIYYRDSDGQWKARPAVFARMIDGNQEVWQAGWQRSLNSPYDTNPALDLEFVVKYEVNGTTYWDNNNSQNYQLARNGGELITVPVLADGAYATAPYTYNYNGNTGTVPGSFSVDVLLQNLGYGKEVKIHYSYDNWTNVHVANAVFQANSYLGYSNVTYPNVNGVEYWSFYTNAAEAQNSAASEVQFTVSYKVNGVTYWDNNFGQNYRVTITKH
ncbi:MAG: hypothetical protein II007_06000 [Gammaproteobacteria bacterium]|nr:hypothetical protein [Gammaproteobacteria bacterium]